LLCLKRISGIAGQQGGVTTHTEKKTAFLQDFFSDRTVRRGLWLPQFPHPMPPDFIMWGFLKERAYSNSPRNLKDLKQQLTGCCQH
jgi:hypothetical protein